MFSLKCLTVDNIVKYVPQNLQSQERDSKHNTIKNILVPRKQDKNRSQNNKKFL